MKSLIASVTTLVLCLSLHAGAHPPEAIQQVSSSRDKSPLAFAENKGQVTDQYLNPRKDIDYKLETPGMSVFIGKGAIHYQWVRKVKDSSAGIKDELEAIGQHDSEKLLYKSIDIYRLDAELIGCNRNAEVIAEEKQSYYETYYTPRFEEEGATIHSYKKLTYKNIYPFIDWVLYITHGNLKYDFVVHPGGNPEDIRIAYKGATTIDIVDGAFTVTTPFGSITEKAPYSYEAETRKQVNTTFKLEDNVLSFAGIGAYTGTLVIDPALLWATYYGGTEDEKILCMTTDASANIYAGGITYSFSNIATTGAHQATKASATTRADAFLVKFNPSGVRQWATYYGGDNDEIAGLTFSNGYVYATGSTYSSVNIATTNSFKASKPGSKSAFLVKFNTAGVRQWGTYFGGPDYDYSYMITHDKQGGIYIGGQTGSHSGVTTPGAFQPTNSTGWSGFIAKFNASGQRLWATYFGSGPLVLIRGAVCDDSCNLYIVGEAIQSSVIPTVGAFQSTYGGGYSDAILGKFDSAGNYKWSTYYGGTGDDLFRTVVCGKNGSVYVAGTATSVSNIATAGAFQTVNGGQADGCIAKFNRQGARLWCTYHGGAKDEQYHNMVMDAQERNLFIGSTTNSAGLATPGAIKTTFIEGYDDWLISVFDTNGNKTWASYYGGLDYEHCFGIAYNKAGIIYIGGDTRSSTNVATTGAHQVTYGGTSPFISDGVILALSVDTGIYINESSVPDTFCAGATINLTYTSTNPFITGNIFTAQLSDASGSFSSPTTIGTATSTGSGVIVCTIPISASGNKYRIRIIASTPSRISEDNGNDLVIISNTPPTVSVTANPGAHIGPWVSTTFTATVTNGGATPTYQWRKNGVDIPGATAGTFIATLGVNVLNNDAISVKVKTSNICTNPDSVVSTPVNVTVDLGIKEAGNAGDIRIYPNPNNGSFIVESEHAGNALVTVLNALGQIVYQNDIKSTTKKTRTEIDLGNITDGIYLLMLNTEGAVTVRRFTINH